jgi:hypothetical protein
LPNTAVAGVPAPISEGLSTEKTDSED